MTIEEELALIRRNRSPAPPADDPMAQLSAAWQSAVAPPAGTASTDIPPAEVAQADAPAAEAPAPAPAAPEIGARDAELGLPPRQTGLAPLPDDDADTWDVLSAAWRAETIRTDAWNYAERQRRDLTEEIWAALPEDARQRVLAKKWDQANNWVPLEHVAVEELAQLAQSDPDMAARLAGLPLSRDAFEAEILSRRRADLDEAQAILDQPGGEIAEFLGAGARAMTDQTSLMLLPFGVSGSAWRMILGEAVLGAAGEAAVLPREFQVAQELGEADPDALTRIGLGAVLGGGLAGAITGGGRLLQYARARRTALRAATPPGADPLEAELAVDAAEAQMRGDETVAEVIQRTTPAAPAPGTLGDIVARQPARAFAKVVEAGKGYTVVIDGAGNAVRREGTRAWRNNNPGNIEYGPFAQSMGAVGTDGRFAVFPTYEQGRRAKAQLLWASKGYRGKTIGQAIARYAPAFENDTRAYTRAITSAIGAKSDTLMSDLTSRQREMMLDAMERVEGFRPGKENGVQAVAPRAGISAPLPGEDAPSFTSSRGYTGAGQVRVSDDLTIDVEYVVVDAGSLTRASGDFQPRDRSRLNSDAWIADTAARLDPAQLMPSPNAATGAPIVGPDGMIESGNGRFGVIARAYERHPDRIAAYRAAIEDAGFAIPEGVTRPVLVAQRRTDLTRDQRIQMTIDAQDSGVAQMTPTEVALSFGRAMTGPRLALFNPGAALTDETNGEFVRGMLKALPKSARNAMVTKEGALNRHGQQMLREAIFARAWNDPDLVELFVEADPEEIGGLLKALEQAVPEWAALKADIEAGAVRPEFDISGHVLDAMRLINAARTTAKRDGIGINKALNELLDQPDLMEGPVAPLTTALVRKFWTKGRAAPTARVADFLTRYAADARKAGAEGGLLDAPTPRDVLRAIDPDTFADLPEDLGPVRGFARPGDVAPEAPPDLPPADEMTFDDGAQGPEAEDLAATIRDDIEGPFGPVYDDLAGQPEKAIDRLLHDQTGEVPNAMTVDGLGPVRFVWGSSGLGLRHILEKHGEAVVRDLPRALREGQLGREYNGRRDVITTDTPPRRTVIRLDWDGDGKAWVLTSHDVIQGTGAQPGRTSNVPTEPAPPSVPGATARVEDKPAAASAQDQIQRELSDLRAARDDLDLFLDAELDLGDGTKVRARDILDDLDSDAGADAVLQACGLGGDA